MNTTLISVSKKGLLLVLLLTWFSANAQKRSIKGKITDHEGQAIPGVTVAIKGTMKSTFSNSDGNYSIQMDQPDTLLTFTFIGFVSKSIKPEKSNVINVELTEIVENIEWCCTTHTQSGQTHCGKDRGLLKKNYGCTNFKKKTS